MDKQGMIPSVVSMKSVRLKKFLHMILVGWRIKRGRWTVRLMPTRWYFGIGVTFGYLAMNFGPVQIFFSYFDWVYQFFRGKPKRRQDA